MKMIDEHLHRLTKRIRMIFIKLLVRPHNCDKVLRFAQIDNVMRVTGQHMYRFYYITADLKIQYLVGTYFALLDQSVTGDDDEKLPLAVVPVLAFRNAGFADINTELAAIRGFEQLVKLPRASIFM